jgi:hypothetical protein
MKEVLPLFVRIKKIPWWNDSITKPYQQGELCKVMPLKEQVPQHNQGSKCPISTRDFRHQYIRVLRKDSKGKFTVPYTLQRSDVEDVRKRTN